MASESWSTGIPPDCVIELSETADEEFDRGVLAGLIEYLYTNPGSYHYRLQVNCLDGTAKTVAMPPANPLAIRAWLAKN